MNDTQNFGKGAFLKEDPRDYKYEENIGYANEPFDWDKGYDAEVELGQKVKVKNQGGSFSCGGQAGAYYAQIVNGIYDKVYTEKSAKFIYAPIFVGTGGTWLTDIFNRLKKAGASDEDLCPSYEAQNTPTEAFMQRKEDITNEAIKDAFKDRTGVYGMVSINIDAVARAIRDNQGCIIGITGKDNGTWLTAFPKPPAVIDNTTWRHWVYACKAKMINGKKYIGFINSWGNIGDNGVQWITEDYFNLANGGIFQVGTMVVLKEQENDFKFTKDLFFGITDPEVKELQKFLNKNGFPVATKGAGSVGKETEYFGFLTRSALVKYQKAHSISPAIGFMGKITRKQINNE